MWERHGRGMGAAWARHGHGMLCVNRSVAARHGHGTLCVNRPLAARHGRGMAWARHVMCESAFKKQNFRPRQSLAYNPLVETLPQNKITQQRGHLFIPHFSVSNNRGYIAWNHWMNNVIYDVDESSTGLK